MNQISLNSSMRSNLLSLQQTQALQDMTQLRLSTGLKVNSAIDNPSNYYTASSLSNRAKDLLSLLDAMSQGIQTIKAASETLTAATKFLDQAKAVSSIALEKTSSIKNGSEVVVKVSNKASLLSALKDEKIDRIVITQNIIFNDNEQLYVGNGKTIEGHNKDITLTLTDSTTKTYQHAINLADAVIKNISVEFNRTASGGESSAINGGKIEGIVNISTTGNNAYGTLGNTINGEANIYTSGDSAYGISYGNINGIANISTAGKLASGIMNSNINGTANISTMNLSAPGISYGHINTSAIVKVTSKLSAALMQTNIKAGAELWLANRNDTNMQKYIQATDASLANGITTDIQSNSDFVNALNEYILDGTSSILLAQAKPKITPSETVSVANKADLLSALKNNNIAKIIITNNITFADNEQLYVGNGKTIEGTNSSIKLSFSHTSSTAFQHAVNLEDASIKNISVEFNRTQSTGNGGAINGGRIEGDVNIFTTGNYAYGAFNTQINGDVNVSTTGDYAYGAYYSTINGSINISTIGDSAHGIFNNSSINGKANISTTGQSASGVLVGHINGIANISTIGANAFGISRSYINEASITKVANKYNSALNNDNNIKAGAELWLANNNASQMQKYIQTTNAISINGLVPGVTQITSDFVTALNKNIADSTESNLLASIKIPNKTNKTWPELNALAHQYNSILNQYNQLINDAGYKGINLLLSQDLKVNFNEERSSKIDVKGVDASTKGLGLTDAKWQSQTDIQKSLDEISSAINQIRSQSSEFGNYYSVVNSRIDFTDNLINVLTEGSDKLTLADMNESSANMLALQTRQQLAINALSLANQASQSVLRLF